MDDNIQSSVVLVNDIDPPTVCVICLANSCNAALECTHHFHSRCIEEWIGAHKNCPICRAAA